MHIKDIVFTGTNAGDQSSFNGFSEASVIASICLFCLTTSLNVKYNKETNEWVFEKLELEDIKNK